MYKHRKYQKVTSARGVAVGEEYAEWKQGPPFCAWPSDSGWLCFLERVSFRSVGFPGLTVSDPRALASRSESLGILLRQRVWIPPPEFDSGLGRGLKMCLSELTPMLLGQGPYFEDYCSLGLSPVWGVGEENTTILFSPWPLRRPERPS